MEFIESPHTNERLLISQNFGSQEDELQLLSDEFSLVEGNHLNAQVQGSRPLFDPLYSDYFPVNLCHANIDHDDYGALKSELGTGPFQSAVSSLYPAAIDLNSNEMNFESNLHLDSLLSSQETPTQSSANIHHEPGCDSTRLLPSSSASNNNHAVHTRTYACTHSSCNHRRFSKKGGLMRHMREVHGSNIHYCPFRSCNRHTYGFARKYNLLKHQENCHDDVPGAQFKNNVLLKSSEMRMLPKKGDDIRDDEEIVMYTEHRDSSITAPQMDRRVRREIVTRTYSPHAYRNSTNLCSPTSSVNDDDEQSISSAPSSAASLESALQDLRSKRDRLNHAIAMLESCLQAVLGVDVDMVS